jgi:8-oxo-dGTP pyrophosphatase MutT (NUDIX family)
MKKAVAIAVINNTQVLSVSNTKLGYTMFPGGKIEEGETPEQAIIRETFEETGLTLTNKDFVHVRSYTDENGYEIDFYATYYHEEYGTPFNKEPLKHSSVKWIDINSFLAIPSYESFKTDLLEVLKIIQVFQSFASQMS